MITFVIDPYIIDPLGIAYLSSMLKKNGYNVSLLLTAKNITIKTPIIGYSVTTGKHTHYLQINRAIKGKYPEIISIFGGPHCTFNPEFAQERSIDYIFRGECFSSIVEFVDNFSGNKDLTTTSNLAFYKDNRVICNPLLPAIKADEIPFPDRKLIYQFKKNRNNPIRSIMASFYCIMSCTYCFNHRFRELGYYPKIRNVENVIEECSALIRDYPTELIYFADDIFPVYDEAWLELFCIEYKKRVGVPFHIQVRIEMLSENKIKMLKSAGLHGLTFAIETADEIARAQLLGRKIRNETIINNAKLLSQYRIKFRIENMLGIPGETFSSALRTLDLNLRCNPDVGWSSLFTPYRGTDLGDFCIKQNLIESPPRDDFFTIASLKLEDKSKIEKVQKLFGLICYLPFLRSILPALTLLPFNYKSLSKFVKQQLYNHRLYKI